MEEPEGIDTLDLKQCVLRAAGGPTTKEVHWPKPPTTGSNAIKPNSCKAKYSTKLEDIIENLEQTNTDLTYKLIDYIEKADKAEKEARYFKERYEELVNSITEVNKTYKVRPRKVKRPIIEPLFGFEDVF